jgi:hypothetical protein
MRRTPRKNADVYTPSSQPLTDWRKYPPGMGLGLGPDVPVADTVADAGRLDVDVVAVDVMVDVAFASAVMTPSLLRKNSCLSTQ